MRYHQIGLVEHQKSHIRFKNLIFFSCGTIEGVVAPLEGFGGGGSTVEG